MAKITFGFCSAEKAHAVQKGIRAEGFRTINTNDEHGFYVHVITEESNRSQLEGIRAHELDLLRANG
ncbi:hypothetical protein ACV8TN_00625 [Citrobacter freundii]|uniref:hypothetical protein n=1 Tax=Citrobacter freundii TaxID=546 RepID=UPI00301B7D13